jgi:hypothetical protein
MDNRSADIMDDDIRQHDAGYRLQRIAVAVDMRRQIIFVAEEETQWDPVLGLYRQSLVAVLPRGDDVPDAAVADQRLIVAEFGDGGSEAAGECDAGDPFWKEKTIHPLRS